MIENNPPEGFSHAGRRAEDLDAVRSRFPFKLFGLAMLLVVLAAVIYMRWPGSGTEPGDEGGNTAADPVRVSMDGAGSLRNLTDTETGPLRLKRQGEEENSQDPGERLTRMEAGLVQVEERVEQLNEKLDLLLLVLSRGQNDSPELPPDFPAPAQVSKPAPPPPPPVEKKMAKPSSPVQAPPAKPAVSNRKAPAKTGKSGSKSTAAKRYHVVEPGENLYRIGLKYNLNVDELMKMNGLSKSHSIRPGQRLLVD